MRKFAVFSGFLGSGKTTAMMALTRRFNNAFGKAAMISNDLGHSGLADNKLALLGGCNASELTGNCICYQTENLVNRLEHLFGTDGCSLVLSDIPGFGVGALEHVYHRLSMDYPSQFDLAPFTVLVEPRTAELIRSGQAGDLRYIFNTQLEEADLIVLNKCDLLSPDMQEKYAEFLRQHYAAAQVLTISAKTGQGIDKLILALTEGHASMRNPDIGYGGSEFAHAMGKISEFNSQFYVQVCCNDFDGNAYLRDLALSIQEALRAVSGEIPHLKLLAWKPEGEYAKVDLLGIYRPLEMTAQFTSGCTELAVTINSSAVYRASILDRVITQAMDALAQQHRLSMIVYHKEFFDVMEA